MKLERRSTFGWPATSAGGAPCRNGLVVHYDGASKPRGVATMDHAKCRQYWKNTRTFHMGPQRRWQDIGYAFGVCGHGIVFEGRGFGREQAAQPGGNRTWTSCTLMLGDGEKPTALQLEGFRELRAWLRGQGLAAAVRGHRDFVSTSCPGTALYGLVKDGSLAKAPATPAPPKPPAVPPWPKRVLVAKDPEMHGDDVLAWQRQMRKRGWEITVDAFYGDQSAGVARSFQREKKLPVTGKVDEAMWKASFSLPVT